MNVQHLRLILLHEWKVNKLKLTDFFIVSAKTSLNADFWEVQAYRGN